MDNQEAKADKGKLQISLVPTQIIKDIAKIRMYGTEKYGDPNNWKNVELDRYVDALLRHTLEFMKDKNSKDVESGIEHYKHMACNMAFICEMMEGQEVPIHVNVIPQSITVLNVLSEESCYYCESCMCIGGKYYECRNSGLKMNDKRGALMTTCNEFEYNPDGEMKYVQRVKNKSGD